MTTSNPSMRKQYHASGGLRLVLHRGYGPYGAFAHFFDTRGRRVDRRGHPVRRTSASNFSRIVWDFPAEDSPHPSPSSASTIEEAIALAQASPSFRGWFDEVIGSGWSIERNVALEESTCEKGPDRILLREDRGRVMVADLVREVALARALAASLPVLDRGEVGFVRANARHLLMCHAEAKLGAATTRDEILRAGGPDIGGSGLRGSQLDAYYAWREGELSPEAAKAVAANSCDAEEARGFTSATGPKVAVHLAAFLKLPVSRNPGGGLVEPEARQLLDRLGALPALTPSSVAMCLGKALEPAPSFHRSVSRSRVAVDVDGFVAAELREVHRVAGEPSCRLVLTPAPGSRAVGLRDSLGLGTPHHVGARGTDQSMTLMYALGRSQLFLTSGVGDGVLLAVTLLC